MNEKTAKKRIALVLTPLMLRGLVAGRVNVTQFGSGGGYFVFVVEELPEKREPWQS